MKTPTYQSSALYSPESIDNEMQSDWLYSLTGGAFAGTKGKQIQAQMNQANDMALETAIMDYENWYNSPAEQNSRRLSAGLGSGDIENIQSSSPDVQSANPEASDAGAVLSGGIQIFSTILQGYQFITSAVARMTEINESIYDTAVEGADLLLGQSIPYMGPGSELSSDDKKLDSSLKSASKFVDSFMSSLPTNKHRRYMKHRIESLRNSPYHREKFNKQRFEHLYSGQEAVKVEADPRNQGTPDEVYESWNKFISLYVETQEKLNKSQGFKADYESEYYDSLDGDKRANAENAASEYKQEYYNSADGTSKGQSENYDYGLAAAKESFISEAEKISKDLLKDSPAWVRSIAIIGIRWLAARLDVAQNGADNGMSNSIARKVIQAID